MNAEHRQLRIGLVGLGLEAYWAQFDGLKARLETYIEDLARQLESPGRVVVRLGLIDTTAKGVEAGHACRKQDIDILLLYAATYSLSSTVLPIIRRAGVPVLLLNLQPAAAIGYESFNALEDRILMTGEWLAHCGACPIPEIANVMRRLDLPVHLVTGMLYDDAEVQRALGEWLEAARVAKCLGHSRLGLLGHYYTGMLDVTTDLAQVAGRFGLDIVQLEVDELSALRRNIAAEAITAKTLQMESFFDVENACPQSEIQRAAQTAVALDMLVAEEGLDLLAYYYKGIGMAENASVLSSIIPGASMLTSNGIPIAGEYEIKNVVAMKILSLLGAGGSFTEYYAMDFADDVVLMGHDGPGNAVIAEGRIKLRPLRVYHGKVGNGLSVEMMVKHGDVTLLSIVENPSGGFMFLVAEGQSVSGPILEIGNTNSRYRFPFGLRRFVDGWNAHGPAHHCAVGKGHVASTLKKLATLLHMDVHVVC